MSQADQHVALEMEPFDHYVSLCCICLEEMPDGIQKTATVCLPCCKHDIHKHCMFLHGIYGFDTCPLCREQMDVKALLSKKDIKAFYKKLNNKQRKTYQEKYETLIHRSDGSGRTLKIVAFIFVKSVVLCLVFYMIALGLAASTANK